MGLHENNKTEVYLAIFSLLVYIGGICGSGIQGGTRDTDEAQNSNLEAQRWIFFIVWPYIYMNQFAWQIYFIYTQIKQPNALNTGDEGEYSIYLMYSSSSKKGISFFILFIISNLFQFSWWSCVAFGEWTAASIIILFFGLTIIGTNIFPHKYLYDINNFGRKTDRIPNHLIYKIVFLNGIQIYATWLTLANCISWSGIMVNNGVDKETAAIIMEIIIFVILIIYLFLDLYKLRKYLQYTYITYLVVILAFFAVLTEHNFNFKLTSQIIAVTIIVITFIALVCKIIFVGCRSDYKLQKNISTANQDTPQT